MTLIRTLNLPKLDNNSHESLLGIPYELEIKRDFLT